MRSHNRSNRSVLTHIFRLTHFLKNHASVKTEYKNYKTRKSLENTRFSRLALAPRAGLEPATTRLTVKFRFIHSRTAVQNRLFSSFLRTFFPTWTCFKSTSEQSSTAIQVSFSVKILSQNLLQTNNNLYFT